MQYRSDPLMQNHSGVDSASMHELMAIFGWLTMKEAERYTQSARRKKLAQNAANLLVRPVNETSPQNDPGLPRKSQVLDGKDKI
jgi:hypothetical protein